MKELEKKFDKKFGNFYEPANITGNDIKSLKKSIKSFYRSAIKKMIREALPKEKKMHKDKLSGEEYIGLGEVTHNLCRSQFLKNLKDKYGVEL